MQLKLKVRQENILGNGQTRTFIYDLFSITEVRDQHLYVRPFRNLGRLKGTGVLVKQLRSRYNRCLRCEMGLNVAKTFQTSIVCENKMEVNNNNVYFTTCTPLLKYSNVVFRFYQKR